MTKEKLWKYELDMIFFAMRYALPRNTGATHIFSSYINKRKDLIPFRELEKMAKEIRSSLELNEVGDKDAWHKILKEIE